ncbi:LPXTG cell wall anchor domain-containing protein [Microbacterium sp. G2-8]|uniref:LPXTG cell wall anchor domain-containing protein n=1 Tax=Microbacterium sp. G2-8 TaxID=2842454 RepID=UPI001C897CFF|nr:LPXTG cell wall anchor domain-containing protein [Microbacterium sp. G2-8]
MRAARWVGALALILPLTLGAAQPAPETVVRGDALEISSELSADATALAPGASVDWTLGVSAPGADESGTMTRTLSAGGSLARHLTVEIGECAEADCAAPRTIIDAGAPVVGETIDLGDQDLADARWLVVTITMSPDVPASAQGQNSTLQFEARGAGEATAVSPGGTPDGASLVPPNGPLATTGASSPLWMLLVAAALGGGGLLLVATRRRDRDGSATAITSLRA